MWGLPPRARTAKPSAAKGRFGGIFIRVGERQQQRASEPVQLRTAPALTAPLRRRQRLLEQSQSMRRLTRFAVRFGKQTEEVRHPEFCRCSAVGGQPLLHLGYGALNLSDLGQNPTSKNRRHRQPSGKALFGREPDGGIGMLHHLVAVLAPLAEHASAEQDLRQSVGVGQVAGLDEALVVPS